MAEFTGTIEEFNKFIGPRVRNVVKTMTKKKKKDLGNICQECGVKGELHAAHKKGMSRIDIIDIVLSKYYIDELNVKIDIDSVDKEIIRAQTPVDDCFMFLCSECHKKYDIKTKAESKAPKTTASASKKRMMAKVARVERGTNVENVDVLKKVRAYCEGKRLGVGTTKSACSLVKALLTTYSTCPVEEQVRADLTAAGKSTKTISNNLWAVRIWAASLL